MQGGGDFIDPFSLGLIKRAVDARRDGPSERYPSPLYVFEPDQKGSNARRADLIEWRRLQRRLVKKAQVQGGGDFID
ncbi:MAG: hypothetical protein KDD68_19805, partial [Bdellovibrionales bacterium]|nr:hypothetical protein [Bdellovibrionales bacterium]